MAEQIKVIKAIIFDCFGVLTTEGFLIYCNKYFKGSPDKRAEAQNIMDQSNRGSIPFADFEEGLAKLGDTSVEIVREYLNNNKANEPLFEYISKQLRPKYKIGMLSNSSANWLNELFTAEELKLFDNIILSYKVGMTKPDPRIYSLAAKRLGSDPSEVAFIDDVNRYCYGAREIGMQAILYEDFEQMKTELEKLLSTSSDD